MTGQRGRAKSGAAALLVVSMLGVWPVLASAAAPPSGSAPRRSSSPLSPRLAALTRPSVQTADRAAQARAARLPADGAGSLLRRADGALLVRLRLLDLSASRRAALVAAGATLVADGHDDATATVAIRADRLDTLAAVPGLVWAQEELTPRLNGAPDLARVAARAAVRQSPSATTAVTCPTGVVTEGDSQLNAAAARSAARVTGAGVKVGIMSDSYNASGGASTDIGNGELPGVGNPCGYATPVENLGDYSGGTDEARAMAQIIHDIAPGAALAVRTAFRGEQDFANGIRALRDAGATVIVDDVSYDNEPMFQDGVIAAAIDDVEATGVTYFSAAGNSNIRVSASPQALEVGSYESPSFRSMACPAAIQRNDPDATCHDFNPATGAGATSSTDQLTVPGDAADVTDDLNEVRIALGWSEPQYGVTTDYDPYLINSSGAIVASSVLPNVQAGTATEILEYENTTGIDQNYRLVIARHSGASAPRFKIIFNRPSAFSAVQWNTSTGGDIVGPTTYGHNAPLKGASVAATPFDNSGKVEGYSSRGPALYCWQPVNGTTAAAARPSCVPKQIDFAATDGAANSFFGGRYGGVYRFYGTSASAPHAAAIAALQRQSQPCRTPAQLLAAMRASGRPIGPFTTDAAGSGLIDATTAISGLAQCVPGKPPAPAILRASQTSVTISWAPPSSVGSPITSYRVTAYTGQSSTPSQTIVTGTTTSTIVTGLTAGRLYRFRVAATNGVGTGQTSGYSTYAAPPFLSLPAFVKQQFDDFAGRPPTDTELSAWTSALTSGADGVTPASRVSDATRFKHWGPQIDPVTRLYYAFFQRAPDKSGLGYWSGRRRNGTHLDVVAQSFASSTEFQRSYGSLTNRQFVGLVYQNVLGRPGDASGIAYWTGQLDARRKSRGLVMIGFSESNEHKNRRAGEVNTVVVYFGMLRRVPTADELSTWVPLSRTSKVALINSLLGTAEYRSRLSTTPT